VKGSVPAKVIFLAAVLSAVIFAFDLAVPLGVASGVAYVAVVLLGIWMPRPQHVLALAAITTLLTITGYYLSPPGNFIWMVLANRALALLVIWISAVLIVQRKRGERELIEREQKYRDLTDGSIQGIAVIQDDVIAFANQSYAAIFGYTVDELIGKPVDEINAPEEREFLAQRQRDRMLGKEVPARFEFRAHNKEGALVWVESISQPVSWKARPAFQVTLIDISDHKKLEQELELRRSDLEDQVSRRTANLHESEARFRDLIEGSIQGVAIYSWDWKPLFANQAVADMFGYESPDDFLTLDNSAVLLAPNELERMQSYRDARIATGEPPDRYQFKGILKDGTARWFEHIVRPVTWRGQEAFQATTVDVTEHRLAEDKLRRALVDAEQANQAKSDFLATMSHELRTPLNAIIGFSDMIEGQYFGRLGSEKYKEYAHDIHSSSEHLLALVNDILDLSAIEAGKQPLIKDYLIVKDVAADCSPIIFNASREKNIEFSVEAADDLPPLYADKRAIKQILFNLLTNAVKYTQTGGKIILTATATNGFHSLEIKDSGIGVPAEKLASLTDPFVRTESDPHMPQEGTGLGLAIVNSLVDLHGGELDIKSEVGVGTTVTVLLPSKIA